MNITPVSAIASIDKLSSLSESSKAKQDDTFKNILGDLIQNANEAEKVSTNDIYTVASGNTDDLHNILINSEKAELAVLTAVQVRNKIVEAYQKIMEVNL
jgi:flagellar hook-basal body complex protein FliE